MRALTVRLACLAGVLLTLTGCLGRNPVPIQHDAHLERAVLELSRTGGTARLRDLTDFSWDRVHVFPEGTSAREVNRTVGQAVLADGSFYYDAGNLLVFTAGGRVVRAVSVLPDVLATGNRPTWSGEVRLEPRRPGQPGVLRLAEPAG